jgi:hypothetical protein
MTERNRGRWAGAALLCCAATIFSLSAGGGDKGSEAAELARCKAPLAGAAATLESKSDPDALEARGIDSARPVR